MSKEIFLEKAKLKHNNKFDYSKINYINNSAKVEIICPDHGSFYMTPKNHIKKYGCKLCANQNKLSHLKLGVNEFIRKANETHNNKYDYSKSNYISSTSKLVIICPIHGEFSQIANQHFKYGCSKCGGTNRSSSEEFTSLAKTIHNDKYDYSLVDYKNSKTRVKIICKIHGEFEQTPNIHLSQKCGCPKCSINVSKKEQLWFEHLQNNNIKKQFAIIHDGKKYKVDGYDPNTNIIYEFYGDFWHGNPKIYHSNDINVSNKKSFGELYTLTLLREQQLISFGYKITSIWESDWNQMEK